MDKETEKLTKILLIVNDWLKFAEAKNSIFLAFSGAGITAIITYISAADNIPVFLNIALIVTTFLLSICSLIYALSFLPKTNLEHLIWLRDKPSKKLKITQNDRDNFYFFKDLMKYRTSELLDAMNRFYFKGSLTQPYLKEHLDIASQIVINSEITFLKLRLFTVALVILLVAIGFVPLSLLINLIFYRKL